MTKREIKKNLNTIVKNQFLDDQTLGELSVLLDTTDARYVDMRIKEIAIGSPLDLDTLSKFVLLRSLQVAIEVAIEGSDA